VKIKCDGRCQFDLWIYFSFCRWFNVDKIKVKTRETSSNNNEIEEIDVITIEFTEGYIEDQKDWIISSLPNLRHLILSCTGCLAST
jgi:hypothetical protein